MKWAAEQIAAFDNITIDKVLENEYLLNPGYQSAGEEPIMITAEDLEVSTDEIPGYEVAVKGQLTVALDITITDDLKKENCVGLLFFVITKYLMSKDSNIY